MGEIEDVSEDHAGGGITRLESTVGLSGLEEDREIGKSLLK